MHIAHAHALLSIPVKTLRVAKHAISYHIIYLNTNLQKIQCRMPDKQKPEPTGSPKNVGL